MAAVDTLMPGTGGDKDNGVDVVGDTVMQDVEDIPFSEPPTLIIPITSSSNSKDLFIEIFPEEMPETPSSTLLQVLKDEEAPLSVWADAALMYIQHKQHARDASAILQAGCERPGGSREERVRLLASAGIAHLTQAQQSGSKRSGNDPKDELSSMADNRFTNSSKVDNLFPMTWMGRGMLNLSAGRLEQARFFFDTTLKECGRVLPALLGLAAVMYLEKNYEGAQRMYAEAIKLYPERSGAATRVGFGLACYRLGQVDRAKAAFARALDLDPENVDAMVGAAVLDMASLDETSNEFNSLMERAIKMMSMANLLDHSNAMVQNHLANHYFWKWTPIAGSVEVSQGSKKVKGSQPIPLDPGERIRIGPNFETYVAEDDGGDADEESMTITMRDPWKEATTSGLKVWKKDYDRVIALAKGAYNSTSVQDIQAESLFFLARVYHIRDDIEHAHQFYERACKLAPNLSPARFGLAQTLIAQEEYQEAATNLQKVLASSNTATDPLAILGLLEVKGRKKEADGLAHLRKAIDLDPLNPDLVLLEALALQQHESNYPKALERYKKAVQLLQRRGKKIPFNIYTNIGVLCHETKNHQESLKMYKLALDGCDEDVKRWKSSLDNVGIEGGKIRHADNNMFFDYVDTKIQLEFSEGTNTFKVSSVEDQSDLLKTGEHVRIGSSFESVIREVKQEGDSITIVTRDKIANDEPKSKAESSEGKEKKESEKDGEKKEGDDANDDKMDTSEDKDKADEIKKGETKQVSMYIKRENRRLENQSAISIAFNLARLHEAAGRTLAAVELHKAILKRNPAYVNCYLRLACISIDCGALKECAAWLKLAAETAPGNPEVLTLIGNLHLSLCDWAPAQQVFDGLLEKKVPNVEAYARLSLGNIYFANLNIPGRYDKHLKFAADFYKIILTKDPSNAYAANGLGTVLAEKAELFKAREVFNRVREVSGDGIADAHLNLGHIYLAQKRHPEALQMYQSYLKRTEDGTAPITSKSRTDDKVDVLLYIAFAYFDWARQTELFNNAKAAPADERYQKAMDHLELAISENTSKNVVLTYNLCMTKLQAANCVLQKLTRNIRRTAKEVEDALNGLQKSLSTVEEILAKKADGSMKVPISTSMLNDFINHCKSNIESAKSHHEDERKREEEANELRELQRLAAESNRKQQLLQAEVRKDEETKKQEERDRKARANMKKVADLRQAWDHQSQQLKAAEDSKSKKGKAPDAPELDGDELFPEEEEQPSAPAPADLFNDSDSDSDDDEPPSKKMGDDESADKKDDNDDDKEKDGSHKEQEATKPTPTEQELFGDSDEDSDEELVPSSKRGAEPSEDEQAAKKRKVLDDDEDSD